MRSSVVGPVLGAPGVSGVGEGVKGIGVLRLKKRASNTLLEGFSKT